MNTALVTTGQVPLTVGSQITLQLQGFLNGQPWDLTGGTVTLKMLDPNGASYSYAATITGGGAQVGWTVLNVVGNWTRAWYVTDSVGRHQRTRPIVFAVETTP